MKNLIFLIFSIFTFKSIAQQIKFSSDDLPGKETEMANPSYCYLPLNDNEFLYAGSKINSYDVNLIKLDKNCKTQWTVPNIDDYLGAAKFGNNIIVFTAKNSDRFNVRLINSVHVRLIDNKTGKIVNEKDIPSFENKKVTDLYILTDAQRNFKYLVLRSTNQTRFNAGGGISGDEAFGNTANLQIISFDDGLNAKTTAINTNNLQNAVFVNCICNDDGDIFIASLQDNSLVVTKYNAGSADASQTLKTGVSFENDFAISGYSDIKLNQNTISVCCKVKEKKNAPTLINALFNFDKKKVFSTQDVSDKDFLKQYDLKNGELNIIGSEFYKDKFIVIQEGLTVKITNNAMEHTSSGYIEYKPLLVTVYSNTLHKLKETQVDEDLRTTAGFSSTGYKILDDKLFLLFNSNKGKINIHTKYQIINLNDFSLTREDEFNVDPKMNTILFGPGTVWFQNNALIPFIEQSNMFNPNKVSTSFKSIDF